VNWDLLVKLDAVWALTTWHVKYLPLPKVILSGICFVEPATGPRIPCASLPSCSTLWPCGNHLCVEFEGFYSPWSSASSRAPWLCPRVSVWLVCFLSCTSLCTYLIEGAQRWALSQICFTVVRQETDEQALVTWIWALLVSGRGATQSLLESQLRPLIWGRREVARVWTK
jgi:hypothetical protein